MYELAFHEAIRSGDLLATPVYADWLEENGREQEAAWLRSGLWRLIPAGSFWMGGASRQKKQVEIPYAFYLGTYTVTQGEWEAVMGSNPSHFSREGEGKEQVQSISDADLKLFPVECVSWDDTQEFIKKLNEREKEIGWLYRLPTEAEWEYACRGAASSIEDCSFYFYLDRPSYELLSDQANIDPFCSWTKNSSKRKHLKRTTKVGSYQANRLGLYDMHGNVCEWTDTLHENGFWRVYRGGSWSDAGPTSMRRSAVGRNRQFGGRGTGFRLARVPLSAASPV